MAKQRPVHTSRISPDDNAISLFDRDNLEQLDALRYRLLNTSAATHATPAQDGSHPVATELGRADQIFTEYHIAESDQAWGLGELNVEIIHRGRIKIRRSEWQPVIATCSAGFSEDGMRKDFHLNVLQHQSFVRLLYVSYRYKRGGEKQQEHRRGILLDVDTDIRHMMTNLAFWFTAKPHAEKNYPVFETLVDEAMMKLTSISAH